MSASDLPLLVDTDWLAARLSAPDLRVFDCSVTLVPVAGGMRPESGRAAWAAAGLAPGRLGAITHATIPAARPAAATPNPTFDAIASALPASASSRELEGHTLFSQSSLMLDALRRERTPVAAPTTSPAPPTPNATHETVGTRLRPAGTANAADGGGAETDRGGVAVLPAQSMGSRFCSRSPMSRETFTGVRPGHEATIACLPGLILRGCPMVAAGTTSPSMLTCKASGRVAPVTSICTEGMRAATSLASSSACSRALLKGSGSLGFGGIRRISSAASRASSRCPSARWARATATAVVGTPMIAWATRNCLSAPAWSFARVSWFPCTIAERAVSLSAADGSAPAGCAARSCAQRQVAPRAARSATAVLCRRFQSDGGAGDALVASETEVIVGLAPRWLGVRGRGTRSRRLLGADGRGCLPDRRRCAP